MKTQREFVRAVAVFVTFIGLGGCAGMSQQDQYTFAGAGLGGATGAALSDGGALGTLGGAAVGGIIGRAISPSNNSDYNDSTGYNTGNNYDNGTGYNTGPGVRWAVF